jgi:hypothetical protein
MLNMGWTYFMISFQPCDSLRYEVIEETVRIVWHLKGINKKDGLKWLNMQSHLFIPYAESVYLVI